jgi:spermidine synthase
VKPFELLGQTISPDGAAIKLIRRGDEYLILADAAVLMSSRTHGSEQNLAIFGCQRASSLKQPSVLVGGLGMGFTLRATLDVLPPEATVIVVELISAVVEWNRDALGPLAEHPLQDRRVRVEIADVAVTLKSSTGQFDAILLDVDNGPAAFTASSNAALYDDRGLAAAHATLKHNGVLAFWSAQDDQKFAPRLRRASFDVHVHRVRARLGKRGARHTIFLGYKS